MMMKKKNMLYFMILTPTETTETEKWNDRKRMK